MFGKSKNDPMLPAIKGIMEKNDAHRKAVETVNEHFGITSRRALPLEEKAKYDIALRNVLAGEPIEEQSIVEASETKLKSYAAKASQDPKRTGSVKLADKKVDRNNVRVPASIKEGSKLKINENVLDAILEERKESGRVVDAFLAKKSIKGKRTHTDGESLYLHGNKIAWHNTDGSVHATMAGWGTVTTRERLNTLANRLGAPKFSQRKGTQYHGDKEIGSKDHVVLRAPTSKQPNLLESQGYSKSAVDKAIKGSKKKIGGKEAKMIHALLKGRQKSDEPVVKEDANLTIACIQQEIAENLMKKYNAIIEDADQLQAFNESLSEEQRSILRNLIGSPFAPNAPTLARPFVGPKTDPLPPIPAPTAQAPVAAQVAEPSPVVPAQIQRRMSSMAPKPGIGPLQQVNAPGYNPHSAEARAARPVVPANSPAVAARARADAATAPQSAQIATPAQTVPASAPTLTQTAAPATEPTTPASTPTEPAAVAQAPATKERSRSKSRQNQVRQRKVSAPMRPKKFGYGSDGSGRQDAGSITNRAFGAVNEEEERPMKRSLESILRDRYGH